jgi:hypothetical protein
MEHILTPKQLLSKIHAYCKRHGISATAFGHLAVGDSALVTTLKRGRDLRVTTYSKIMKQLGTEPVGPAKP